MPDNLWSDAEAAKFPGYDELVYRAHLLGQDPTVTNWKGGNISGKYVETDFDGSPVRVLRIKGSGSDLRTATREDFAGVRHDPVLKLLGRREMSDEEMVKYLAHCLTDIPSKRPSIETLMHSFMPFEHIDHTHSDASLGYASMEGGRRRAEEALGEGLVWVDYHRPGFHLARTVGEAVARNPKARCVILAKHGLLTWGRTSKECYHNTLAVLNELGAALRPKAFAPRVASLSPEARRDVAARVMPAVRGAVSALRPAVLHFDDSPAVLEFVNGAASREVAAVGAATPDHLVSTKRVPCFSSWDPREGTADSLKAGLLPAIEGYRRDYEAWFKRWNRDPKTAMDDPFPRIILVPGLGMISTGKTKELAVVASWLYHRAIAAMKGAESQGKFLSLNEEESFNIEYWPLERYKLSTLPPDKELTGRVAVVIEERETRRPKGPGEGIQGVPPSGGRGDETKGALPLVSDVPASPFLGAIAKRLAADGAHVAGDVRRAVLEYGGLDVVVAPQAPPEAFEVFREQGRGGSLILLGGGRLEAPAGVRVNGVRGESLEAISFLASPRSAGITGATLG